LSGYDLREHSGIKPPNPGVVHLKLEWNFPDSPHAGAGDMDVLFIIIHLSEISSIAESGFPVFLYKFAKYKLNV